MDILNNPGDELPIFIRDNPSRDFFFPLNADEIRRALVALPEGAAEGLTYIWLRRASGKEMRRSELPLAQFICGSGVRLIVLYPWRRDLRRYVDSPVPRGALIRAYRAYAGEPEFEGAECYFQAALFASSARSRDLPRSGHLGPPPWLASK